ncbi:hypothetical protein NUBL10699_45370 [Klebsiella pneumoniae]|nr:hypothetical protein NUBL10699_45370 [Klebsiella pneumoniae]
MKQTFLSGATLAALVMLVALPLVFILLQAIFPHFSAGSLGDAFGGIPALLADPQLPAMLGGTLWIAAGVALVSVMIGLPLGILRGMFSLPLPRLWDLLFLIPFLTPPYISALSWMLALQSQGYLQQLTGWQLNDLLFSRSGIVLVMTFNRGSTSGYVRYVAYHLWCRDRKRRSDKQSSHSLCAVRSSPRNQGRW